MMTKAAAKVETLRQVTRERDAAVALAGHQLRRIRALEKDLARLRKELVRVGADEVEDVVKCSTCPIFESSMDGSEPSTWHCGLSVEKRSGLVMRLGSTA